MTELKKQVFWYAKCFPSSNGKYIDFVNRQCFGPNNQYRPSHFSQKSAGVTCSYRRSQQWQWDSPWESAAELVGLFSRWNNSTGRMGALKYCKRSIDLVLDGEDASAAFCWKSPSFLSSIPGSAFLTGLEMVWSPLATHGSPQRAKCYLFHLVFFFFFFALLDLSWLDCTGKNKLRQQSLFDARYIFFIRS